jgi:hypothetical protein
MMHRTTATGMPAQVYRAFLIRRPTQIMVAGASTEGTQQFGPYRAVVVESSSVVSDASGQPVATSSHDLYFAGRVNCVEDDQLLEIQTGLIYRATKVYQLPSGTKVMAEISIGG